MSFHFTKYDCEITRYSQRIQAYFKYSDFLYRRILCIWITSLPKSGFNQKMKINVVNLKKAFEHTIDALARQSFSLIKIKTGHIFKGVGNRLLHPMASFLLDLIYLVDYFVSWTCGPRILTKFL